MTEANRLTELRGQINAAFIRPEQAVVSELQASLGDYDHAWISGLASRLIGGIRGRSARQSPFGAFLREYGLNSEEGIVLMGIAETLLRIPDTGTQQRFLQEKLADADWHSHLSHSDSRLVNLASGALLLGGRMEDRIRHRQADRKQLLDAVLVRLGQPLALKAIRQAMQHLAQHFVLAENMPAALAQAACEPGWRYSFDMLGESALTAEDAEAYHHAYVQAIEALAAHAGDNLWANPGISVKLSALYPRYEVFQQDFAIEAIGGKLLALARLARAANVGITLDAEESERLDMSLAIFATVAADPALQGWPGLGLAVQAYQKRALPVIRWLLALAEDQRRIIPIRLVKGAYWDSEIKRAQENGWSDYPVFTRKAVTDASYLACARLILSHPRAFYPQFATHNAYSVAAICRFGELHPGFEFQRLHGMGAALYQELPLQGRAIPCRVYAPVGSYRDLLPYLVRRLLENVANTSFIHQLENPAVSIASLTGDPLQALKQHDLRPMMTPPGLFGPQRVNSHGQNLCDPRVIRLLRQELTLYADRRWQAAPLVSGKGMIGVSQPISTPFDRRQLLGQVTISQPAAIRQALQAAGLAFGRWRLCPVENRAACLYKAADLLERHRAELVGLCIREAGRTLRDALAEIREAVDFCRYYAAEAIRLFATPAQLPGPTGEDNRLYYYGRGVFVCISPWNFPISIFVGQIAAALAAGNTVIAKPALQASLTAMLCVRLLHQAGIPEDVLHFLPGEGAEIGGPLLSDERVAGVAFTGSVRTAQSISRQLAARPAAIATLIAETGGQNVMIADSTAHEEQLIGDVLQSAFNSAGQRCSALRVLFLPEQTAERIIGRLIAAMQLLRVGSPLDFATDIGPVIDERAAAALQAHVDYLQVHGKILYRLPLAAALSCGCFFAPTLAEIPALPVLRQEVFGPILHIVRYAGNDLARVVDAVNATGYGLTLGVHSRINASMDYVRQHARVGNIYINRNMIGAVVGAQPFGGMGLSGTGPKAGGPGYLLRFCAEQTVTTNLAAMGGNPWLLREQPE
ncbi:MAG: bifunctional proline dehydrogenase/L-glutamate gamma-semialdehyde dehydrogenase PutA [Methylococcales bacterium]|nr:bifunctional proline dehydrogenase/L-glutamate gamma-semialdehyde dehydrogenase PutA [Methylococcales bacterium]